MSHTPGPWEADYGGTVGHIKSIAPRDNGMTPTVARYNTGYCAQSIPPDEHVANARLIALAPCMLDALTKFVAFHDADHDQMSGWDVQRLYDAAIVSAKEAINKATGAQENGNV